MSLLKIDKYMFLFTRRRKRLCLATTLFASLLFVSYQFIILYTVSSNNFFEKPTFASVTERLVRGIHLKERSFYIAIEGKFTCFKSGEVIEFSKVNDNYCDCADSTDEPGTNACPDGQCFGKIFEFVLKSLMFKVYFTVRKCRATKSTPK